MTIKAYMHELGSAAKLAAKRLALSDLSRRNDALKAIATAVDTSRQHILEANEQDLVKARANGLDAAAIDRLTLNDQRLDAMIASLQQVMTLADPHRPSRSSAAHAVGNTSRENACAAGRDRHYLRVAT